MFRSCGDMCWILKGCHFHASSERTEEQCHWWSLRMDATRGASKNSLYQEIKWFSPLWKHWGCQQRKLTWNSGVPGTRRVSRLVWPWASLSLSLGFSQASLQLTEPDVMGGFQLCPCPWWSQVTAAAGLRIRWLRPHSPSATGRCMVHESTTAGEQQPHCGPRQPGETLRTRPTEKERFPFPWTTGYQVARDCRSGIWGWSHYQRKQEADERDRMPAVLIVAPASSYAWS